MSAQTIAFHKQGILHTLTLHSNQSKAYLGLPQVQMTNPNWHPDGKMIAFGRRSLYLLDLEKEHVEQITGNDTLEGEPSCSPDGRYIVYTKRSGAGGLYLYDMETQSHHNLYIEDAQKPHQAAWSPTGTHIVFVMKHNGKAQLHSISTSDLDAPLKATHIDTVSPVQDPAWNVDGTRLVFSAEYTGRWTLCLINADGTGLQRLSTEEDTFGDFHPSWNSEDDIVFHRKDANRKNNIFMIHADGTQLQQLTQNGGEQPEWCPSQ